MHPFQLGLKRKFSRKSRDRGEASHKTLLRSWLTSTSPQCYLLPTRDFRENFRFNPILPTCLIYLGLNIHMLDTICLATDAIWGHLINCKFFSSTCCTKCPPATSVSAVQEEFRLYTDNCLSYRVHTEWQLPLSGVHSIMMEKLG